MHNGKMLHKIMKINDAEAKREAVKRFMGWMGINSSQWCKRAGVPYSTLNGFLTGQSNDITYGTLDQLAKALPGITVGMIMGEVAFQNSAKEDFEAAPQTPQEKEVLELFRKSKKAVQEDAIGFLRVKTKEKTKK